MKCRRGLLRLGKHLWDAPCLRLEGVRLMRHPLFLISVLLALAILPQRHCALAMAVSQTNVPAALQFSKYLTGRHRSDLDILFKRLKEARSESEGQMIERQLWQYWTKSGHLEVESLMKQAHLLAFQGYLEHSVRLLDRVVYKYPNFVDGWNRRANVFFMMRRYEEALQSIARVLALEPRHFGALTGKAFIHMYRGSWQKALDNLRRAVDIHPFLRERTLLQLLERKLHWRRL